MILLKVLLTRLSQGEGLLDVEILQGLFDDLALVLFDSVGPFETWAVLRYIFPLFVFPFDHPLLFLHHSQIFYILLRLFFLFRLLQF